MPYKIKKAKGKGWDIVRLSDGKVVGHSDNVQNAKGSIAHRMDAENGKA